MSSWREIERIRKDPRAFRALAASLLKNHRGDLTEWEIDFLEANTARTHADEFSTRQAEALVGIRDGLVWIDKTRDGFVVATLIRQCHEARLDLAEADEDWIVEVRDRNPKALRRRDVGRLCGLCRQLNILDPVAA